MQYENAGWFSLLCFNPHHKKMESCPLSLYEVLEIPGVAIQKGCADDEQRLVPSGDKFYLPELPFNLEGCKRAIKMLLKILMLQFSLFFNFDRLFLSFTFPFSMYHFL